MTKAMCKEMSFMCNLSKDVMGPNIMGKILDGKCLLSDYSVVVLL